MPWGWALLLRSPLSSLHAKPFLVPWLSNSHFYGRLSIIIHSLAYLSSAVVLGLTMINLVLVNVWRTPRDPAQFARSIQGRCHWDLDVVWSGTGMACAAQGNARPFGVWLGAAIFRLVMSAVLVVRMDHSPESPVFSDPADRLHTTF
jgi:hypothetical protein